MNLYYLLFFWFLFVHKDSGENPITPVVIEVYDLSPALKAIDKKYERN